MSQKIKLLKPYKDRKKDDVFICSCGEAHYLIEKKLAVLYKEAKETPNKMVTRKSNKLRTK